eukprot:COSAG05_NODE_702_length_7857_cov_37.135244_7_plen_163_part_00
MHAAVRASVLPGGDAPLAFLVDCLNGVWCRNPHMLKRRVASQLEDTVMQLASLKSCIKVMPMVEEYARQLKIKADATRMLISTVQSAGAKKSLVKICKTLGCDDDLDLEEQLNMLVGDDDASAGKEDGLETFSNPLDDSPRAEGDKDEEEEDEEEDDEEKAI